MTVVVIYDVYMYICVLSIFTVPRQHVKLYVLIGL